MLLRARGWPLVLVLLFLVACAEEPAAVEGWLDLRGWRPQVDGAVRLDGTWDFYWQRLVPADEADAVDAEPVPITVPLFWQRTRVPGQGEEEAHAARGYGTYRLRVRLPPNPPPLALRLVNINSAVEVFAQGRSVWRAGRVGTDARSARPTYRPGVAFLPPLDEPVLDLVIHVSHYSNSRGGLDDPLWLGVPSELFVERTRSLSYLGLIVGGLLIMGLYHLVLYALRRRSRIALYFGLVCFSAVGRLAFTDELLVLEVWPGTTWEPMIKGMFFFSFSIFGTFGLYLEALWPRAAPRWMFRSVSYTGGVGAFSVLLLPTRIFTRAIGLLEAYALMALIFGCLAYAGAMRRREEGRWIYTVGFFFAGAGALHDVVVSQGLLGGGLYMGPVGIYILLFAQSTILAQRFAGSLTTVERQRSELQVLVDHLERERRERERYEELSLAASGLAHETKNPLGIIRGLAQRLVAASDGDEAVKRRAGQILDQADLAASRLGDFLSYARLRDPESETVDLAALLRYAREILAPDLEAKSIACAVEAEGVKVLADEEMLLQIVLNLMLNSIAASASDGSILLGFEPAAGARDGPGSGSGEAARDAGRSGRLVVIDHGVGIAPDRIEAVRRPYVSGRADGHGLGLALVERLADMHGWRLHLESELGVGTRVAIEGLEIVAGS